MSTDSPIDVSEFTDEIKNALSDYYAGFIQKPEFVMRVGGLDNAEKILKLDSDSEWEIDAEPDSAQNSDPSPP